MDRLGRLIPCCNTGKSFPIKIKMNRQPLPPSPKEDELATSEVSVQPSSPLLSLGPAAVTVTSSLWALQQPESTLSYAGVGTM